MSRTHVERVREAILADKGRRTWEDLLRSLQLVTARIFGRATRFVLELLQNAEDAGLVGFVQPGAPSAPVQGQYGEFRIWLSNQRVKVAHSAPPFRPEDFDALCGIRTTKKPEEGTLGYLGIGFKSVFKVTDRPEIYSGTYSFKFDKSAWPAPEEVPWQILPVWVEYPTEQIDPAWTTYILPFRTPEAYHMVRQELLDVDVNVFLFLRWIKKVSISDEITGESLTIEHLGTEDGVTTIARNAVVHRFVIFSQEYDVPPEVRADKDTLEYDRGRVARREVVAAFGIDDDGNLIPIEKPGLLGGLYSFVPIREENTGVKFLIHSDFLVLPGRESINYDALWNRWLVGKVAELCKAAVAEFKAHPVWSRQFLPLLETRYGSGDAYDRLFRPYLHEPLRHMVDTEPLVPTLHGQDWVQVGCAVIPGDGVEHLVSEGELSLIFGDGGWRYADASVRGATAAKKLSVLDLPGYQKLLSHKAGLPDAACWFRRFYLAALRATERDAPGSRSYVRNRYLSGRFILLEGNTLAYPSDAYLIPGNMPYEVQRVALKYGLPELSTVNGDLFADLEEGDRVALYSFLKDWVGVREIDAASAAEMLAKRIGLAAPIPSREELVDITRFLKWAMGRGFWLRFPIYVLTKRGEIKPSAEVYLSSEFSPRFDWEKSATADGVPLVDIDFVATEPYLGTAAPEEEVRSWRNLWQSVNVRDEATPSLVGHFAERWVEWYLTSRGGCSVVRRVSEAMLGYDVEAVGPDGVLRYYECKGFSGEGDVRLEGKEFESARTHGDRYVLAVVSDIPNNPTLHLVPDPVAKGMGSVVLPAPIWRGFRVG